MLALYIPIAACGGGGGGGTSTASSADTDTGTDTGTGTAASTDTGTSTSTDTGIDDCSSCVEVTKTLVGSDGNPLANKTVTYAAVSGKVLEKSSLTTQQAILRAAASYTATTNANGQYTVNVPLGNYTVTVKNSDGTTLNTFSDAVADADGDGLDDDNGGAAEQIDSAPTVTNSTISSTEGATVNFTNANFSDNFTSPTGQSLQTIKFVELSADGTLAGASLNQEIDINNIGNLSFATTNANFAGNVTLKWKGAAADGVFSATEGTLTINFAAVDDGPEVANTVSNVSRVESGDTSNPASGTIDLSNVFNDPDNDNGQISIGFSNSNENAISLSWDSGTKVLTWTQTGIGTATITAQATSNGKTVDHSFTIEAVAQATTLGSYLIGSDGSTHINNISGVANGAHHFYIPVSGISTSLLSDAQVKDMVTIGYATAGNYGCTNGSVIDKNNWTVDKTNNRIRIDYTVADDTKADNFTMSHISGSSFAFGIMGINN